jgi:hypothetical protein
MSKEQFRHWIATIQFSNSAMHQMGGCGLGAKPERIQSVDPHAARLLEKARAAHDELTAYLTRRTEEGR